MNIFEPQPDFAAYDTFLFAILGLASGCEKIDNILHAENNLNGKRRNEEEFSPASELNLGEQEFDYALLGALSLHELVKNTLKTWQSTDIVVDLSRSESSGFEHIDDLLR